jgi:RNA polymerase sigma-70 factor (ECF subfamily)
MALPAHDDLAPLQASLDDARKQFLAVVRDVRPRLHRFCARMCGSVLDGEDVVQETLAQGFYSLSSLEDRSRLEPWLFRIAHHKCVDFLRRERRAREDTVPYDDEHDAEQVTESPLTDDEPIDDALVALVGQLPPKERASVLLKDVLDYRLSEIAAVVDSTVGGVKAALHRGRAKLRALRAAPSTEELDREQRRLLEAYAECFNRRDWDALRRLIQVDARLEVVGAASGTMLDVGVNYFSNYTKLPWEWRLAAAVVDGEPMIVVSQRRGTDWRPMTAVRLWWRDGRVVRIRDYVHVDYVLQDALVTAAGASAPSARDATPPVAT